MRRIASIALAFLLAELTARLLLAQPVLRQRVAGDDDATWRLAWAARQDTGRPIYYAFDVFDPTKGWVSRAGLRAAPAFDGRRLTTNSLGLRGAWEPSADPPPAGGRVALVGDSFTFGDEVSDDETVAARLAARLPGTEIVNLGVHGYGHDQMLVLLRESLARVRPTIVVLLYVSADAIRNTLSFRDYAKPRFVSRDGELMPVGGQLPSPEELGRREWLRPRLSDLFVMLHRIVRERTGAQSRDIRRITAALLRAQAAEARAVGAAFRIVELPTPAEMASGAPIDPLHAGILADACGDGVPCYSLRGALAQGPAKGLPGGHWDPTANAIIADALADWLGR